MLFLLMRTTLQHRNVLTITAFLRVSFMEMKAIEQYFFVVLFIVLYELVLYFCLRVKS